ncbi:MAG: hypothetical protein CMH83_19315 [Nocardioides sp.]|nr:hypothetical protein [Nocardioides sp.]
MIMTGRIDVELFGGFRFKRNPDRCLAESADLRRGLEDAVVRAPDGREIVTVRLNPDGLPPTYTEDGEEYYSQGICMFTFTATIPEPEDGVYTVAFPTLGLEKRFTADAASELRIEYDPT